MTEEKKQTTNKNESKNFEESQVPKEKVIAENVEDNSDLDTFRKEKDTNSEEVIRDLRMRLDKLEQKQKATPSELETYPENDVEEDSISSIKEQIRNLNSESEKNRKTIQTNANYFNALKIRERLDRIQKETGTNYEEIKEILSDFGGVNALAKDQGVELTNLIIKTKKSNQNLENTKSMPKNIDATQVENTSTKQKESIDNEKIDKEAKEYVKNLMGVDFI